jgi:hypothetical protein
VLPRRAAEALRAHKKRQAAERLAAGESWQDSNLIFCREDGPAYTRDALNWRPQHSLPTHQAGRLALGVPRPRMRAETPRS